MAAKIKHHEWFDRFMWLVGQVKYIVAMVLGAFIGGSFSYFTEGSQTTDIEYMAASAAGLFVFLCVLYAIWAWRRPKHIVWVWLWDGSHYVFELLVGSVLGSLLSLIWVYGSLEYMWGSGALVVGALILGVVALCAFDAVMRWFIIWEDREAARRRGVFKTSEASIAHLQEFQQHANERTTLTFMRAV